jgi:hypothetical protein
MSVKNNTFIDNKMVLSPTTNDCSIITNSLQSAAVIYFYIFSKPFYQSKLTKFRNFCMPAFHMYYLIVNKGQLGINSTVQFNKITYTFISLQDICKQSQKTIVVKQKKNKMTDQDKILSEVTQGEYKYGFFSDIETDIIDIGLNEDVIRTIWQKKNEPDFMLEFRLNAYRKWLKDANA